MMHKMQFSKLILLIESALVFWTTWRTFGVVCMAIEQNYAGTMPYLTTLISAVWAAYGTSVSFYYNKAKAENKIKLTTLPDDRDI